MAQFWTDFTGEDTDSNYIKSSNWAIKLVDNRADDGTGSWRGKTTCYFRKDQSSGKNVMEINQWMNTGQTFIQCNGVNTSGKTRVESLCKFSVNAPVKIPGSYGILLHRYSVSPMGGFTLGFVPSYNRLSLFLNDDFTNNGANFTYYEWENNVKYWLRYRTDGDNQYCKIWKDGEKEPTDWSFSSNYKINAASNATYGVGNYKSTSTITYYQYSIGTDGDTAPMYQYEVKQKGQANITRQPKLVNKANSRISVVNSTATTGNAAIGSIPDHTPLGVYGGGWGGSNGYGSGYGHGIRPAFTVEHTNTTANAHIERIESVSQTANSHIEVIRQSTQTANATLESFFFTAQSTQTANATLEWQKSIAQKADAFIEWQKSTAITANSTIIWQKAISTNANARIQRVESVAQNGDARIERVESIAQNANANIIWQKDVVQRANAFVEWRFSESQTANAFIEWCKNAVQTANAELIWQKTVIQSSNSHIERIEALKQSGNAHIERINTLLQYGNARVERIEAIAITANAIVRNPTPEKRPQEWSESGEKQPVEWGDSDSKENTSWQDSGDALPTDWTTSVDSMPANWSESGEKQPVLWQPEYYD